VSIIYTMQLFMSNTYEERSRSKHPFDFHSKGFLAKMRNKWL